MLDRKQNYKDLVTKPNSHKVMHYQTLFYLILLAILPIIFNLFNIDGLFDIFNLFKALFIIFKAFILISTSNNAFEMQTKILHKKPKR